MFRMKNKFSSRRRGSGELQCRLCCSDDDDDDDDDEDDSPGPSRGKRARLAEAV